MSLIVALIIVAFTLFFFEIFVPGGILAFAGSVLLFLAAIFVYMDYGLWWALLVMLLGPLLAIGMFFLELKLLANSKLGRQIALKSTIAHKLNPKADENLVGMEGVTLTVLAPTGKVRVGDKTFTASAEDGFLERGVPVTVLRSETFKLIVDKK